jgi:hypothetical protein
MAYCRAALCQSAANIAPQARVHKLAKMPRVGGDDNNLGLNAESKRLGCKDHVDIEVERRRSWTALLASLSPKLRGGPQCLVGHGQVSAWVNLHEGIQAGET